MDRLYFSIAGIPETTPDPSDISGGLKHTKNLGIDGIELEFVHNIWLTKEKAPDIGKLAKELNLILTIHAPYYINLNTNDNRIKYGSISRIVNSALIGSLINAYSITFHPGFYLKDTPADAYLNIHKSIEKIALQLQEKNIHNVYVRPETTGKRTQFGSLEEILELSKDFPFLLPCVDFAHLHARSNGKYNSEDEFKSIIDLIYNTLGENGINNMHMHYSGIDYSEKGEKKHLPLKESDANFISLLKVLKERKVKGVLVCESPIRDTDTLLLKDTYNSL